MPDDADDGPSLAELLAGMPELYRRLLAEHTPDARGRCRSCTVPGTGLPGARWPCIIAVVARQAQDIAEDR